MHPGVGINAVLKEYDKFDVSKVNTSEDLKSTLYTNGCYTYVAQITAQSKELTFKFANKTCCNLKRFK